MGPRPLLQVHDRTGEGPSDASHGLHPRHHQLTELVDVLSFGADDHDVGAGDGLGLLDTGNVDDVLGDLGGLADLGLDEDVCRYHSYRPPRVMLPAAPCRDWCRREWWHAVAGPVIALRQDVADRWFAW